MTQAQSNDAQSTSSSSLVNFKLFSSETDQSLNCLATEEEEFPKF